MVNLNFAAQVADWCHRVEGATEAVFKESSQELAIEVQKPVSEGGRMRVDTGFLRASLLASTSAMPGIIGGSKPVDGMAYAPDFGQIEAVIAGSEIGDTIYLGFTAGYAGAREYGARGQAPDAFVRTAAQRWSSIVDAKAAELKGKLGI